MSEIKKILIGYDGLEQSETIIEDLQNAGMPEMVEALVLTVAEAWELPSVIDRVASADSGKFVHPNVSAIETHLSKVSENSQTIADSAVKHLQDNFPEWNITGESVFGKPAVELINKADEWKPDLLVVGSQGRSAIGRFLLGSVSQKVLYESHCSVRISKKRADRKNVVNRVLIAVDGSENAEAVVRAVASRNWSKSTEIRLIAVNDPFTRTEAGYLPWNTQEDKPEDNEKSREWISKVIDAPAQILESAGLNVLKVIRWGDAANLILKESHDWGADSIFLGARGLGRFKRFLLGSVSSTIAVKADCSVEVVRQIE